MKNTNPVNLFLTDNMQFPMDTEANLAHNSGHSGYGAGVNSTLMKTF